MRRAAAVLAAFCLPVAVIFGIPTGAAYAYAYSGCAKMACGWIAMVIFYPVLGLLAVVGIAAGLFASHHAYRRIA